MEKEFPSALFVCLEMEKEGQKLEQEEVEEQEEEETTVLVRKSRNENDSNSTEIAAVDVEEVSNGVSESNGHTEFAADGAKSEDSILEEDQKTEDLDGVLENESEAIQEDQKSDNLVFYDKTEGIWKCRICTWTYQNGSFCLDHIQDHKGLLHKLMNVKTLKFESEGVESASTFGENQIVKDPGHNKLDVSSLDFVVQNGSTSAINDKYDGVLENDTFSSSNPQTLCQEHGTDYKASKEIESAEVDLDDLEVAEFDVERVIQKQTTHDLYCPNCNSCITKRVILHKRKRRIQVSDEEVKRNKIEADFKFGTGSVHSTGDHIHHIDEIDHNDSQAPTADEDERDRGPDIFRCLSCFSFFIPTRNGFRLFQIFGDKSGKELKDNVQDERAPFVKKPETAVVQGSSIQTDMPKGDIGIIPSSNLGNQSARPSFSQEPHLPSHVENIDNPEGADTYLLSPRQKHALNGKVIIGSEDRIDAGAKETIDATLGQFDAYTEDQLKESKFNNNHENVPSVTTVPQKSQVTNGKPAEDAFSFSQRDGLKMPITKNNGSLTVENSDESQIPNQPIQLGGQTHSSEVSQHAITKSKFEIHDLPKVDDNSALKVAPVQQGKDTLITIVTQAVGLSQTVQDTVSPAETTSLLQSATQISVADQERAEERKELEIEVIKSIVYGGLAESITSLSVVSSTAGGGAATLNVLAVGVANLIGGLFIISHNLWELRSDYVEQVANQVSHEAPEREDRYKELLGRRRNFIFHFIVAIISYLVFGSVAPVVYGFSFRKTDDKQLKLIVTAAASLLCILLLAIGRAYVRTPPKPYVKTVITFVVLGFMVSGVSYAAGEIVEGLLEKLGLFLSSPISNLLLDEMVTTGSGRAAY